MRDVVIKRIIMISTLFSLLLILVVGCSNNESNDSSQGSSIEMNTNKDNNDEVENQKENEQKKEDKDEKARTDERVEHQFGLKLGESGVVEDGKGKYEITLISGKFKEELGGFAPQEEVYMIIKTKIKNIGDIELDTSQIFEPDISTEKSKHSVYINSILDEERDGVNLFDEKIKTGESVEGDLVFDTTRSNNYKVAFGQKSDQIITRAEWEIERDSIK